MICTSEDCTQLERSLKKKQNKKRWPIPFDTLERVGYILHQTRHAPPPPFSPPSFVNGNTNRPSYTTRTAVRTSTAPLVEMQAQDACAKTHTEQQPTGGVMPHLLAGRPDQALGLGLGALRAAFRNAFLP